MIEGLPLALSQEGGWARIWCRGTKTLNLITAPQQLLEGLRTIGDRATYHLAVYQVDAEDLIKQFEKLLAFYREAAGKGLAAITYAA
ncbi:MAG: hypothetical protein U1F46_00180 [Marinagarivorans sp.]